jgi:AAA+ ATPase superfamily predicted ATPase
MIRLKGGEEVYFVGREREIARIRKAMAIGSNVVLTGKYGVGRTSLIRRIAKLFADEWRFLFADFSRTPAEACTELLKGLEAKGSRHSRHQDYKRDRSMFVDLASREKGKRRCVIVLDNIEKLTPQKMDLIRYLERDKHSLFIAVAERFLPEEGLFHLRVSLYPSVLVALRNLSGEKSAGYFRFYAAKHRLPWTESDIRMLTLGTGGYPLAMREAVTRELERAVRGDEQGQAGKAT